VGGFFRAFTDAAYRGRDAIMSKLRTRTPRQRDRGLIFEGTASGFDGREFGFLVTTFDRSYPEPIAWLKVDLSGDAVEAVKRERRALSIARMIATNHSMKHAEAVPMDGLKSENFTTDRRVSMLVSMALSPITEVPPHFCPFENFQCTYAPGLNMKGPLAFCTFNVDAMRRMQEKSRASTAPIIPSPASKSDETALSYAAA
jgi:hypothetical protein